MSLEKRYKVVKKYLSLCINIDNDLRAIYIIFSMLMQCNFFKDYCIQFLTDIYLKILLLHSQSLNTNISVINSNLLDNSIHTRIKNISADLSTLPTEKNVGITKLFEMIPKIINLLISVKAFFLLILKPKLMF